MEDIGHNILMTLGQMSGTLDSERKHLEEFRREFVERMDDMEIRVRRMEVRMYALGLGGGIVAGLLTSLMEATIRSHLGI